MRIFLPWHRAYLLWLETHIQDHDENVTLPWWNWASPISHQRGIPLAYDDETATVDGRQVPNVLKRFRVRLDLAQGPVDGFTFRADPPSNPFSLPFPHDSSRDFDPNDPDRKILDIIRELEQLLSITSYVDFSNALEDVHDAIHGWVGGVMGGVSWAAFDPIFWAHHCMIDRIWWIWQSRHGNTTMPANILDVSLTPFNRVVRDVLDVNELGYEYAGAATG